MVIFQNVQDMCTLVICTSALQILHMYLLQQNPQQKFSNYEN